MADRFASLPLWPDDSEEVVQSILSRPGAMKILLKIKDDAHFLQEWIDHHAEIVGLENIIILDNMSSDERVWEIYKNTPKEAVISRFDLLYNMAQNTTYFGPLYDAIAKSCRYFVFLDADEYLVHIGADHHVSHKDVVRVLMNDQSYEVYPSTWLTNGIGSRCLYECKSRDTLGAGLHNGKPILGSRAKISGSILHNYDIDKSLFDPAVPLCFFVLHRLNLFPAKRIESNLAKMRAEGVIAPTTPVEDVINTDFSFLRDPATDQRVGEIKMFSSGNYEVAKFAPGYVDLRIGERIRFFSHTEQQYFDEFRNATHPNSLEKYLGVGRV